MKNIPSFLAGWLPITLVILGSSLLPLLIGQQILRMDANDPQIQLAEDAAHTLESGTAPDSVIPATKINLGQSLAPFVAVFSDSGALLATSGLLHGQPPKLPSGVLDYVRAHGEDRVTWQPEAGVRMATVAVRFGGDHPGFVLAGRSLRESEERANNLLKLSTLAAIAMLAASLTVTAFCELALARNAKTQQPA